MDCWLAIPTASDENRVEHLPKWRARGYKIALLTDEATEPGVRLGGVCDRQVHTTDYRGYPESVRHLCTEILAGYSPGEPVVIVAAGDDMTPDPSRTAAEIAELLYAEFPDGFGVIQPTGDRSNIDDLGRSASERICGSPIMGRAFVERINGGRGPFWPEYFHYWCDEEMKNVTERFGILRQRRDLTHQHHHWSRKRRPRAVRPHYLKKASDRWAVDEATFRARHIAGYPGSEPLPAA